MLFFNTRLSCTRKARYSLARACGRTIETLENRRLLSVTGLDITAITSSADTDGGAGGLEHVTVVPGSTVTATFTYTSTATLATTAKFDVNTAPVTVTTPSGGIVSSGLNQTATLSLVIPLDTIAGSYTAHVQVKNGTGSGSTANDSDTAAVDVILTVAPLDTALSITAGDVTYSGSAYSLANITPTLAPSDALGTVTFKFFSDSAGNSEILAPTNAGTYYVQGHFASDDVAKWLDADSNIASFTIDPLATTLSITADTVIYNGSAYAESNIHPTLTPSDALGTITCKFFSDPAGANEITAPTNAGTYYVQAHFAASTDPANWLDSDSDIVSFTVEKAPTTLLLTAADVTYDGSAYSEANLTADLTPSDALGTITYKFFSDSAGTNEIAAPTNAGTYYVQAHFAASTDPANWLDSDSDIVSFTINKAALTGIARTQDALNIAKQGTLTIDISSIAGLQAADTIVDVFGSAVFTLTIGVHDYEFQPTVSIDTLTNTVHVSYALKGGTAAADLLRADLIALDIADGGASTSASKTPYSTMWVVAESTNYTFADDFLTRLFCSAK